MKGLTKPKHSHPRGRMGKAPGSKRPAIKRDGRPKAFSLNTTRGRRKRR